MATCPRSSVRHGDREGCAGSVEGGKNLLKPATVGPSALSLTRGVYALALEEERRPALRRFGRAVAGALGLPGEIALDDWTHGLRLALGLDGPGPGRLVVLDEFPYLLRGAPEIQSVIQAIYDEAREDPSGRGAKLIVCGSAFSVMSELLSDARPLRGRARLNLLVRPFDFRAARRFWGVEDLEVALRLHAVVGGTPGYRDLTDGGPQSLAELDSWLENHVLNPSPRRGSRPKRCSAAGSWVPTSRNWRGTGRSGTPRRAPSAAPRRSSDPRC